VHATWPIVEGWAKNGTAEQKAAVRSALRLCPHATTDKPEEVDALLLWLQKAWDYMVRPILISLATSSRLKDLRHHLDYDIGDISWTPNACSIFYIRLYCKLHAFLLDITGFPEAAMPLSVWNRL
jgi:hypothetical protein